MLEMGVQPAVRYKNSFHLLKNDSCMMTLYVVLLHMQPSNIACMHALCCNVCIAEIASSFTLNYVVFLQYSHVLSYIACVHCSEHHKER
jgi:hypothetical protein